MSKTAADHYDVRWRATGTLAWSAPQATAPNADIVVEGLERDQQYDFEVRAVSACGAMSAWVPGNYTVPSAPPGTIRLDSLKTEVDAAQADADAANAALAGIASDDVLSASEKSIVIRDNSVILSEHAGIDAQATAYGITTETTAYDGAVSALSAYLAGLTTPTAWNDVGGNTTIDGPTFRGKFADVYTTRQTLLNAIYAAAKAKADAAQSAANTAQGTANTALDQLGNLSNSQYLQNPFFTTGDLTGWSVDDDTWVFESGSKVPWASTSYAIRYGSAGDPDDAIRNHGVIPVYAGAVLKAQCSVFGGGSPDGTARVQISWREQDDTTIISTSMGNAGSGNGLHPSYVTATAPAGAVYAHVEAAAYGHTTGYYCIDNFAAWALTDTLDQVPDGAAYSRQTSNSGSSGALIVDNANFQMPFVNGAPPGWESLNGGVLGAQTSSPAPAIGVQSLVIQGTGTAFPGAASVRHYACNPGDTIAFGGVAYAFGNTAYIGVRFGDSAGSLISTANASTTNASWTSIQSVATVPAGAVSVALQCVVSGTTGYAFFNSVWASINDLRVAGSGQTVGDLRNLSAISAANYGLNFTGMTLSYTSTTTTATLNASAATLEGGGVSIGYSASSKSVSGSGTQTWFMWYEDPGFAGGAQTLHASTNYYDSIADAGSIYIGSQTVTFATSGGGTTPPPDTCVDCDAFVLRAESGSAVPVRARDIIVGDWIMRIDGSFGMVTYSQPTRAECVTVHAAAGSLTCSATAPLGTPDGQVLAPGAAGHVVLTRIDGKLGRDTIVRVERRGERDIQHITCEDSFFLAGDDPSWMVAHHNRKPGGGP